MDRTNLRLLVAHVVIPFATGAGLGTFFLWSIYYLDVAGMRTLLAAGGGDFLDLDLIPFACAFGSLAIGTNQAMTFLLET